MKREEAAHFDLREWGGDVWPTEMSMGKEQWWFQDYAEPGESQRHTDFTSLVQILKPDKVGITTEYRDYLEKNAKDRNKMK